MTRRLRRPGSPWRLLVHEWAGRAPRQREGTYGTSHHVTNQAGFGGRVPDSDHSRTHEFPGTEFDELVVGQGLIHIEQMDTHVWWLNVGGVTVHVTADRDGRPRHVWVAGPGDYDERRPGCTYRLTWGQHVEEPAESGPRPTT